MPERLEKPVYMLIGKWKSEKGFIMEFHDDGSCVIDGKTLYYTLANQYSLCIGTSPSNATRQTYEIVDQWLNKVHLKHVDTRVMYRMERID